MRRAHRPLERKSSLRAVYNRTCGCYRVQQRSSHAICSGPEAEADGFGPPARREVREGAAGISVRPEGVGIGGCYSSEKDRMP